MGARKVYDIAVKTRSYTDVRTGEKKGVWQNVGAVWKGDDGNLWISLSRWFNPAGIPAQGERDDISLSLFPPKGSGPEDAS